jgi:aminoglycoside/choline kinase family phosphotransferase
MWRSLAQSSGYWNWNRDRYTRIHRRRVLAIKFCIPAPQALYNLIMHEDSVFFHWCARTTQIDAPIIQPLAVEASHRRFYRVQSPTQTTSTWVAMNSPPALEQNEQFVILAAVFADHGIPVPSVIATDLERGFVLMSDLGATELAQIYGTENEQPALEAAVATLPILQTVTSEHIPVYDEARLTMEFDLFDHWTLRGLMGHEGAALAASGAKVLNAAKIACVTTMLEQPQTCVHRDYHCRNLLFNQNQLGIVDFQDALLGPALYDIASLLRDCYYRHSEAQIDLYLRSFLQQSPLFGPADFNALKRAFDLTAVQRQIKALGIFARLHLRDNKSSHLVWIKPVLQRLVEVTGAYEETRALSQLLRKIEPGLSDALGSLA